MGCGGRAAERLEDGGVEAVFGFLDAGVEGFCGVAGQDRHAFLTEDRPRIHSGIDPVNRAARLRDPGFESLLPSGQTGKERKQRRVDIKYAPGEGREERFFDHAEVAGQDDQVGADCKEAVGQGLLDFRRKPGAVFRFFDEVGGNVVGAGQFKNAGPGVVRSDEHRFGGYLSPIHRLQNGLRIGTSPRSKKGQSYFFAHGGACCIFLLSLTSQRRHKKRQLFAMVAPKSSTPLPDLTSTRADRQLARWKTQIEKALDQFLPAETFRPVELHQAMRYTVFNGGKRLRPLLSLAAADLCGGSPRAALPAAGAVELIHTYSLIHDDLPCMDDDDLRRGRPTCHKVFGEALALLTGDALLTEAFAVLARQKPTARYGAREYISTLAEAAGSRALIAGQVADMDAEGRKFTRKDLLFIHRGKTAAMIVASLRLGAMSANCPPTRLAALTDFGWSLGLAFQVVDDVLDVTQSSAVLGKSAGKDVAAGKATYPVMLGISGARRHAARLTHDAIESLEKLGPRADLLRHLAKGLLLREF